MQNKYLNKKCEINGMVFDSRKEARRYCELLLLVNGNYIKNLQRQVKYVLIPAQYEVVERYDKSGKRLKDGKKLIERECAYVADFVYEEDGKTVIEDTKGMKTKDYIIKRKLMLFVHGIRVREV